MSRFQFAIYFLLSLTLPQTAFAQSKNQDELLNKALNSLHSGKSKDRCRGLQQLAILGQANPKTVKALSRTIKDLSEEVRISTVQTLGALSKYSVTHPLILKSCRDESGAVRIEASAALASLPPSKAKDAALFDLLQDSRSLVLIRVLYDIQSRETLSLPMIESIVKLVNHPHPKIRLGVPKCLMKASALQLETLFKSYDQHSPTEQRLLLETLFRSSVTSPWIYKYFVNLLMDPNYREAVTKRIAKAGVNALPALVGEYQRRTKESQRSLIDRVFESIIDNLMLDNFSKEMIDPLVFTMIVGHEEYADAVTEALSYDSEFANVIIDRAFAMLVKQGDSVDTERLLERFESLLADWSLPVIARWAKKENCHAAIIAANLLSYYDIEWHLTREQVLWGLKSKKGSTQGLTVKLLSSRAHGEYFTLELLKTLISSEHESVSNHASMLLSDLARSFRPARRFLRAAAFSQDPKRIVLGLRHLPKGIIKDDSFIQLIFDLLEKEEGEERDLALAHLTAFRGTPTKWTKSLQNLAKGKGLAERCAALKALSRQKSITKDSRLILIQSLLEKNETTRATASDCLRTIALTREETLALVKKVRQLDEDGEVDSVKDILPVFRLSQNSDKVLATLFEELAEDKDYQSAIDTVLSLKRPLDKCYSAVLVKLLEESFLTGQTVYSLVRIGPACLDLLSKKYDSCSEGSKALILTTVGALKWCDQRSIDLIKKGLKGSSLLSRVAWDTLKKHYNSGETYGRLLKFALDEAFQARPEIVKHVKPEQRLVFESLLSRYEKAKDQFSKRRIIEALSYCQVDRSAIAAMLLSRLHNKTDASILRCFERIDGQVLKQLLKLTLNGDSSGQLGALKVLVHCLRSVSKLQLTEEELDRYVTVLTSSIKKESDKALKTDKVLVLSYLKHSKRFDQGFYHRALNSLQQKRLRSVLLHRPVERFSKFEEALFCAQTESLNNLSGFDQFCHAIARVKTLNPRLRKTLLHFSKHYTNNIRRHAYQVLNQYQQGGLLGNLAHDKHLQKLMKETSAEFSQTFVEAFDQANWISRETFHQLMTSPFYLNSIDFDALSVLVKSNIEISDDDLRHYLTGASRKARLIAVSCLGSRGNTLLDCEDVAKAMFASDFYQDRLCAAIWLLPSGPSIKTYRPLLISFMQDCSVLDEEKVSQNLRKMAPLTEGEWRRFDSEQRARIKDSFAVDDSIEKTQSLTDLKPYLDNSNLSIRCRAIYQMARVGARRRSMVLTLGNLIPEAPLAVKRAIAYALINASTPRSALISVFEKLQTVPDRLLRMQVIANLIRLGKEDLPRDVLDFYFTNRDFFPILGVFNGPYKNKAFDSFLVTKLKEMFKSTRGYVRERAAMKLLSVPRDVPNQLDFVLSINLDPIFKGEETEIPVASVKALVSFMTENSSVLKKRRCADLLFRVDPKRLAPFMAKLLPILFGTDRVLAKKIEPLFRVQRNNTSLGHALLKRFSGSKEWAKRSILRLLGTVSSREDALVEGVLKLKIQSGTELQREQLKCLGSLGYRGTYGESELLLWAKSLQRPDSILVLKALARRLPKIKTGQTILKQCLSSKETWRRILAVRALRGEAPVPSLTSQMLTLIDGAKAAEFQALSATLASLNPFPEDPLIEKLGSSSGTGKLKVLTLLMNRRALSEKSQKALLLGLRDPSSQLREYALRVMVSLETVAPELRDQVVALYQRATTVEKELALKTLCSPGFSKHKSIFDLCIQSISESKAAQRHPYLQLMIEAGRQDVRVFERLLFDKREITGDIAIFSRYQFTKTQGLKELKKALESENPKAKRRALGVLFAIGKPTPTMKALVEKLVKTETDTEIKELCRDLLFLYKEQE